MPAYQFTPFSRQVGPRILFLDASLECSEVESELAGMLRFFSLWSPVDRDKLAHLLSFAGRNASEDGSGPDIDATRDFVDQCVDAGILLPPGPALDAESLAAARITFLDLEVEQIVKACVELGAEFELSSDGQGLKIRRSPTSASLRLYGNWLADESMEGAALATNKARMSAALREAGVPVAPSLELTGSIDVDAAWKNASALGLPVVVKPRDGAAGVGVSMNVDSRASFAAALERIRVAAEADPALEPVVVEKQLSGSEFRVAVVDARVVGANAKGPPIVTGDGKHDLGTLIALENEARAQDPRLQPLPSNPANLLGSLGSIPRAGERVPVCRVASFLQGGERSFVDAPIHSDTAALLAKAASLAGLRFAGIDVLAKSLALPPAEAELSVIEVNAQPGLAGTPTPTARPWALYRRALEALLP